MQSLRRVEEVKFQRHKDLKEQELFKKRIRLDPKCLGNSLEDKNQIRSSIELKVWNEAKDALEHLF